MIMNKVSELLKRTHEKGIPNWTSNDQYAAYICLRLMQLYVYKSEGQSGLDYAIKFYEDKLNEY